MARERPFKYYSKENRPSFMVRCGLVDYLGELGLTTSQGFFVVALLRHVNRDRPFFPQNKELAKKLGITTRGVKKQYSALKELGYLKQVRRTIRFTTITLDPLFEKLNELEERDNLPVDNSQKNLLQGEQKFPSKGNKSSPLNSISTNTTLYKDSEGSPVDSHPVELSEGLEGGPSYSDTSLSHIKAIGSRWKCPAKVKEWRGEHIKSALVGSKGSLDIAYDETIRLEIKGIGIKTSIIHSLFSVYGRGRIVEVLDNSYFKAKTKQSGWILSALEKNYQFKREVSI